MTTPVRKPSSTVRPIQSTPSTVRPVDAAVVAAALGGEPIGECIRGAGPMTLYALRAELFRRRQSSGGRPGIAGTDQRVKIPVSDLDWSRLEALAVELSGPGTSPSAGQVASILLSLALDSVKPKSAESSADLGLTKRLAERVASPT